MSKATSTPTSVIVALTTTRKERLLRYATTRVGIGERVVVVTGSAPAWQPLPDGVEVLELLPLEAQHWTTRWFFDDRALVIRPIDAIEAFVARVLAKLTGSPRFRTVASERRRRLIRGRAGRWRRWTQSPRARHLRPWLLWRSLRKAKLGSIAPDQLTTIVWGDQQSWPITWHLCRRSNGARVLPFYDVDKPIS